MTHPVPRGAAALLAATVLAGPAGALTAPELWADWQATSERLGLAVEAESEEYEGGTLRLEGLTMTQAAETLGVSADSVTRIEAVSLVEDGDAVRIELAPAVAIVSTTTVDGERTESTGRVETEGLDYVARDEDGARRYDMTAALFAYVLDDVTNGRGDVEVPLRVELSEVRSEGTLDGAGGYDQTMAAAALTLAVDSSAQEGGARIDYALSGLSATGTGRIPETAAEAGSVSPIGLLGMFDVGFSHEGAEASIAGDAPQGAFTVDSTTARGETRLALDEAGFRYDQAGTDLAMTLGLPGMPAPVDVTMAEAGSSFVVPLAQGPGEPYALEMNLTDLVIDDAIWGMFDPTGQLPRTPATVALSLAGTAELLVDPRGDVDAFMAHEGPPARPETLDLRQLLVRFAGAELAGSGALRFRETDAPMPEAVGTIDLALTGGMALLDGLVALGLVPQGQAQMARGMVGMVARPVGDDRYESTIDFAEDGSITANGMQLR